MLIMISLQAIIFLKALYNTVYYKESVINLPL